MLNPYSAYAGRKYAAYRAEQGENFVNLPDFNTIVNNNYQICEQMLIWQPSDPFLKKICELWDKTSFLKGVNKKYWAYDVLDYYRQGLIEIFVHQQLLEGLISGTDIAMDENEFKEVVLMKKLLPISTYKCLALAFELDNPEDIVFTYIHTKAFFGEAHKVNRKWMNEFTMQDMVDKTLPADRILSKK